MMKVMKTKILRNILPFLLDAYVCHIQKLLSKNTLKRPTGWKESVTIAFNLSNMLKSL